MKITDNALVIGKVSSSLLAELKNDVVTGRYKPGQFLPSERQLSSDHKVAQSTMRRALKALEAERVIVAQPRHGYRVLPRANDPFRGCPLAFLNWRSGVPGTWSFDDTVLAELSAAASARGWSLLTLAIGNMKPTEIMEHLSSSRAFGVAMSTPEDNVIAPIIKAGFPALMLDQLGQIAGVDSIMQDGHQGGIFAARHLLSQNCRRIAWFGPLDGNPHTLARLGGASSELILHGKPLSAPDMFVTTLGAEVECARKMLASPQRPDGIIALWQGHTLALKQAADELGLTAGRDFQMVGWCPEECFESTVVAAFRGAPPPIVTWSIRTLAQLAVARIAERRENMALPAISVKIPTQLRLGK